MHQPISLVIPHFNRSTLLRECVSLVLQDPRINEICISDDCSQDGSFLRLLHWAEGKSLKVSLYRNLKNLDCYFNKQAAVKLARNDWVILFDDDNIIGLDYLDTLFSLERWDTSTIYCPEFAYPHFDYRAFSGVTVDRTNVASLMPWPHFATALNTANYFFNKATWLSVWDPSVNPHTADSIYQAYRLLQAGYKLHITPGLKYFHRVHEGSYYKNNVHKTGNFAAQVENKLKQLKK